MWLYVVCVLFATWILERLRRIPRVSGLHKKCVVITGCDSGFGNALAKSLYSKGVYVFAGCFTEPGASKLSEETGERLKTFMLDVGRTESIEKAFTFVKNNLPDNTVLWGVVNNAGTPGSGGPCEIISREDMLEAMNVNCFGMAEMVRVFLPLIKQSRGRIVNTTSNAGVTGAPPSIFPYMVSKFAAVGYSEALRHEKAIWGIKVSTICPGMFNTAMLDMKRFKERMDQQWAAVDPTIKEEYGEDFFEKRYKALSQGIPKQAWKDLSPVVTAYEHALYARYPKNFYYPGVDSLIFVTIHKWFPWAFDILVNKIVRMQMPKVLRKQ